ncbi:MAG: hypothetical protein ACLR8P_01715 [Clostridium fessum]
MDNELYSGYAAELARGKKKIEYCRANKQRTECLWMNFEPERQMRMF